MLGIQTFTCKEFNPLNPKLEDLDIDDIAHSLSLLCRYLGHCKWLYSVGQHSVLGARWFKNRGYVKEYQLAFLLHDASESYLNDVPRPLKHHSLFNEYRAIEAKLQALIYQRFRISHMLNNALVHWMDQEICHSESKHVLTKIHPMSELYRKHDHLKIKIEPWTPEKTEDAFLNMFFDLIR